MNLQTSPLPDPQWESLRQWLDHASFDILITVLQSKVLACEFEAMKSRQQDEGINERFEMKARTHAFEADHILATIKLLQELKAKKTKPPTHTITPI